MTTFGICYYPEHWPEARWAEDAHLLKEAGLTVVRFAEFAWSTMEPAEGHFDFAWLDRAIEVFAHAGFEIILGTPTAAPPAWLVRPDPEILPVDDQGRRRDFGGRRHYCPNNARYHAHTRRIVTALAERYGQHPAISGWQIDNEFGGGHTARCYCPVCAQHFRLWLQARYGTLAALNEAWGAVFWSMTYLQWEHIAPPILNLAKPNPSHVLDYYRFSSDAVVAYQQLQIEILRSSVAARQFITHNFMGLYPDLNYFDLARSLDFVTWDSYPTGNAFRWRDMVYGDDAPEATYAFDVGDPAITGFAHDLTRGLLRQPFWIMEQQVGHINWGAVNHLIRPGTVRLWVWHALGAGAAGMVYFRERATLYAQEQYHSGLLHHDGTLALGYREQQRLQAERAQIESFTAAPPRAAVALLWNYDDLWALQTQPHHNGFSYLRHLFVYYRALQRLGLAVDVVDARAPLDIYQLVIAPSAHVVDAPLANTLHAYVEAGGTLMLSVRAGFKTSSNRVTDTPLPGLLRDLTGATVAEWGALPANFAWDVRGDFAGIRGATRLWAEALRPDTATPRLWHAAGPYADWAALTENVVGRGRVFYVGWLMQLAQATALLKHFVDELALPQLAQELPPGLIATQRGNQTLLLNFTDAPLTARVHNTAVQVPPRDVLINRSAK